MYLKKINVEKTIASGMCIIHSYWYFLQVNFGFQPKVCDGCHDLMQKAMSFNDVAIVPVKGNDYRIYLYSM